MGDSSGGKRVRTVVEAGHRSFDDLGLQAYVKARCSSH